MMIKFSLTFLCVFLGFQAMSQETTKLILLNGKELEVFQLDDSTQTILTYQYDKNFFKRQRINLKAARKEGLLYTTDFSVPKADSIPSNMRNGSIERDEVFAIVLADGTEKLQYTFNEAQGNYLAEEEMRAFVTGRRDARYGVQGKFWFYSGMAVGALSGYAMKSSMLALAIPPLYSLTAQIPVVKIRKEHISNQAYFQNKDYAAGYGTYARGKFTKEALKGSVIGMVIGVLTYAIVNNN